MYKVLAAKIWGHEFWSKYSYKSLVQFWKFVNPVMGKTKYRMITGIRWSASLIKTESPRFSKKDLVSKIRWSDIRDGYLTSTSHLCMHIHKYHMLAHMNTYSHTWTHAHRCIHACLHESAWSHVSSFA